MSKKTDQTLKKCEDLIDRLQELKKALGVTSVNVQSNRKPVNALGVGWSQDPGTGAFHHSSHGIISTSKNPSGSYDIKHGGRMVGRVGDMSQAGHKIKNYVGSLQTGDTGMHNLDPMKVAKDDVEKSGYGPKGAGLYNPADSVGRKARNTGSQIGAGPNVNAKAYSTKPGQLSAKAQAAAEASKAKKLSGPVKQYTPAQIAAINEARKLKKNVEAGAWISHNSVPNADEEVEKLKKVNPPEVAENIMANQLANMMQGRAMLGTPPPRQPTDQEMFGHLIPSEEELQKAESSWNNKLNWLEEAMKPIAARFDSPEQEQAYWDSIKVSDKPDGNSGY